MDALEILKTDHERLRALFDRLELCQDNAEKGRLLEQVRQEFEIHSWIEETVFYPFFAGREGFGDWIRKSFDEHQEVRSLLDEVFASSDEGVARDSRIGELILCVEQHVREEEDELFPRVEKALDTVQLMQLADRLEEAKNSLPAAA